MTTQTIDLPQRERSAVQRVLMLVWQDPADRRFVPVAELQHLVDGRFVFAYLTDARSNPRFFALDEYPSLDRSYVSDSFPVFFSNRVMSAERPSYDRYLRWLGLDETAGSQLPMEVLARTGGGRATDTFHIVDVPVRGDKTFESRFFISGLRHVDGASEIAETVHPGDRLELRPDPKNPKNSNAVIIDVESNVQLGWVPDWLCGEVMDLIRQGWVLDLQAEQINVDAPAHTRVLCRLSASLP